MVVTMWNKFKTYWNKEDWDYSVGLVDPFEYHKTFFAFFKAFGVADVEYKNKSKWLHQNTVLFIIAFFGQLAMSLSLFHGLTIFDINLITEAGTYVLLITYKFLILITVKVNVPEFHSLQKSMKRDFNYICTEGQKFREKYFQNQLITWKLSILACVFTFSIGAGMASFATAMLIHFLCTYTEGDEWTRPLLFPFWLADVDFGQTPYFEVAFVFANICVVTYGYNFIFNIQTQIVWIRHITSKSDIIISRIEDLLDGIHPATNKQEYEHFSDLIVMRMRKIVMHHQEMLNDINDYSNVYKKMLLYEQMACGPIACLCAYCTAEKLDEGEFQLILPLIFVADVVLSFIPCYFCTFLAEKTKSISDALWNIPFWIATPVIRPYMVIVMQRALRPLPLGAPGFEPVSLETFSKTMAKAYSTFNMLRQT